MYGMDGMDVGGQFTALYIANVRHMEWLYMPFCLQNLYIQLWAIFNSPPALDACKVWASRGSQVQYRELVCRPAQHAK